MWTRSVSATARPSARRLVTMRSMCRVFHSTTAFDSRLRQLALFMIVSKSPVRNSPWLAKNSQRARADFVVADHAVVVRDDPELDLDTHARPTGCPAQKASLSAAGAVDHPPTSHT